MSDEEAINTIKSKIEGSSNTFVAGLGDGVNELKDAPFGFVRSTEPDGWITSVVTMKNRSMLDQSSFPSYADIARSVPDGKKWIDPNPPACTRDHVTKKLPLMWWFPEEIWGSDTTIAMFKGDLRTSGISVSDCNQGDIGDCWFIDAMQLCSLYYEVFKRVFSRIDATKGIYEFKFYDVKKNQDVKVCVDERILVHSGNKAIVYCSSKTPGELWPCLLEKAYAKVYGSYTNLESGITSCGITDLLRKQAMMYGFKRNSVNFQNPDKLFLKLKSLISSGYIVANGFQEQENRTNDTRSTGLNLDPNSSKWRVRNRETENVISGHAYGILRIYDLSPSIRLVKIRNPWGRNSEWQGDWSDKSSKWTEHPEIAEKVGFSPVNDGVFFMHINDLAQEIRNIAACRVFESGIAIVDGLK